MIVLPVFKRFRACVGPSVSCLEKVYPARNVSTCEKRLCSVSNIALYRLNCDLELISETLLNCGKGLRAWATLELNPGYGIGIPAACAAAELILADKRLPRERYFKSKSFIGREPRFRPWIHLPTYSALKSIPAGSSRSIAAPKFWLLPGLLSSGLR